MAGKFRNSYFVILEPVEDKDMSSRIVAWSLAAVLGWFVHFNLPSRAQEPMVKKMASIEGITEYELPNGVQLLLFPDPSKSQVTVNMTVFVGSRHEGYGEAGMAHLLEHMMFKGTPSHEKIPDEMKNRGADFNGTTWLDRTNYYETLPATSDAQAAENLEYALSLEADRLMNSYVRGEDLASEMTVVRNEFESGENNPRRVLMQRVQAVAYEWHNYGRSTIGNRSDIERVPIDRLRDFYRKFYRPDNIMLVVAGKFDPEKCLELVAEYFGVLKAPEVPLDRTYTTEPPQDGERTVVLRRVGSSQLVSLAYHVPAGGDRDFAAIELLGYVFGAEPSGRLYKELVIPEIAANASSFAFALHDPGIVMFTAQVSKEKSIEDARQSLLSVVELVPEKPITEEELVRARTQFMKDRELRANDSKEIAIELSEWAAEGDWRLYFLFRDYIEQVTAEECTKAAAKYLVRNNRTVGLFIPSEKSERIEIPTRPDLKELLANYQGRGETQQGENFDPDPVAIEKRTIRGKLSSGLKTAFVAKKTRGQSVSLQINLRYGNEAALKDLVTAAEFLPEMMMRGTINLNHEQLQDRLDEFRAKVGAGGTTGLLQVSVETKREYLDKVLPLIGEILRSPRLESSELEVLRRQSITSTESQLTEPHALAGNTLRRLQSPYAPTDVRYTPTLEERIERYRSVSIDQIRQLHATMLSGQNGEVTAVGDFDSQELVAHCEKIMGGWTTQVAQQRITQPAVTTVAGGSHEINTPDKANAVLYGGEQIAMRDSDPDYPALFIGNYILGGGSLSSRLADRIRQREGLSYGVGSSITAHPIDQRTNWTLFAITNPGNRDRLLTVMREEIEKILAEGVSQSELDAAIQGYLQSEQLSRTDDSGLAQLLSQTLFVGRTLEFNASQEKRVAALTPAQVKEALVKYLDLKRLLLVTAGDFRKPQSPGSK